MVALAIFFSYKNIWSWNLVVDIDLKDFSLPAFKFHRVLDPHLMCGRDSSLSTRITSTQGWGSVTTHYK
jgi:hypothetical protein